MGASKGRRTWWVGVTVAAALLVGVPATGSSQVSVAADGTYNNDIIGGSWGLGGRLGIELPDIGVARWEVIGAFVYYFPSCGGGTCDWSELQGTLLFYSPRRAEFDPYVGVGASFHSFELAAASLDDDDWGIDLVLGSKLGVWGPVRPYGEVRYKIMNDVPSNQFAFTFGVRLGR